jgi:VIT1/CCC1 family predicted Fe2+/Mn2+ transporter
MQHDALEAHARDELGITDTLKARPMQAAGASALSFAIGAALPLAVAWLVPLSAVMWSVFLTSVVFLAVLGALAARTGGANMRIGATRITFWGALAMAVTTGVGMLFGVAG